MKRAAVPSTGARGRLLAAAVTLTRRSGLSGAGINELVRESGAPKGSVYHFFPEGKQQIVSEALERYARDVVAFIDESLSRKRTPAQKVKALFEAFGKRLEQGGFRQSCAAGTVCLDLDAGTEALRPVVATTLEAYRDAIARHFDFGSARRARSFAGLLLSAIEGAYIRGRAERSAEPFREAGEWLATIAERAADRRRMRGGSD